MIWRPLFAINAIFIRPLLEVALGASVKASGTISKVKMSKSK